MGRTDLMQFWHSAEAPPDVEQLMDSWRTDPDFLYHRYCWESAHAFIREHFDRRFLGAFESCAVPAMQCDVFRLCWILAQSGVYIDADQGNRGRNQSFTDRSARGHLYRGRPTRPADGHSAPAETSVGAVNICNGLMSFFDRHDPLVCTLLERVVDNIEHRIDEPVWRLTGPGVISELFRQFGPRHELFANVRIHGFVELGSTVNFVRCEYKSSREHWKNVTHSIYR